MKVVSYTNITAYPLFSRGKVRDIYKIDEETLLIVTTDRMSAFDVVMKQPVPYKGVVLNKLTLFWMDKFKNIVPNHILEYDINHFPSDLKPWYEELEGRAVIARKATPLPVECITRGYIAGSGWKSYQKTGEICGHKLPSGLKQAQMLESPLFTPSTKAGAGQHDENIDLLQTIELIGSEAAHTIKELSLSLYTEARDYAQNRGIIVADTKFEFGYINNTLHLIDEVLTPDSSRFWPLSSYKIGQSQASYDKQYLRDWLSEQDWNHEPPPPVLPVDVIEATEKRYLQALDVLTK